MRLMRAVLWFLLTAALLGVLCTFAVEASYTARATKVQVVRIDHTARNPFGPVTVDLGPPTDLLLDDTHAFLKGKTPMDLPMVDAEYVKAHGDTVLQLKTVMGVTNMARVGCAISALIAGLGLIALKRLHFALSPTDC